MKNPWKALSKINPQREDTHRRINSDVFRALAKADLTLSELKVILCIIDLTWGYNKVFDAISLPQISQGTGLSKRGVIYSIQTLRSKRIIHYEPSDKIVRGSRINRFLFNKHYDTWLTSEQACTSEPHCTSAKVGMRQVNGIAHSIEIPSIEIIPCDSPKDSEPQTEGKLLNPDGQDSVTSPPAEVGTGRKPRKSGKPPKEPADPQVTEGVDYFVTACKELKNFEYKIAWGQDQKMVKDALKSMELDEIKDCMKAYILSPKSKELGTTISIALGQWWVCKYREAGAADTTPAYRRQ